ncbi:MAG: M28 family peptidase, partial [Planctomycetota bacterium]|nr:M28 family peptidase [Planctomycetota bacterium]
MPDTLIPRPPVRASALAAAPRAFGVLALAVLAACASQPTAPAPAQTASATQPAAVAPQSTATAGTASGASGSATATAATPATAAQSTKTPRTGPGLFADLTQPGKGTPKPRATAPARPATEGKVIPGAVNVYTFDPAESFVPADPKTTSLAQVLADMGPDAIEWYQHVQTLSNPWFEGRVPGSAGIEHAANYLEFWMKKTGLEPAFAATASAADAPSEPANPWRQPFDLPGRERRVKGGALSFDGGALEASVARPMKNSGGGQMEGPIAFIGYGIEDGKDGYNSFAPDERFEGTVVMVMRGEPLNAEGKSAWGGEKLTSASSLASKLDAIKRRGANGIIVTDAPGYAGKKIDLATMSAESLGGALGVPVFYVDGAAADAIVKKADPEGRDLATLRLLADSGTKSAQFRTVRMKDDAKVSLKASIDTGGIVTHNVGGILRGKGSLADEWVVVGAHYDHVGYGMFGADPANRGKLHPGADDNASGTSGMAFSAEEMGLNGSRFFVKTPSIPAEKVDIMLNMDMIGRLRSNEIVIGGVESAEGFSAALEPMFKKSGLTVYADPSGRSPSDHASFFGASIPVLFFFSGVHDSYHKPGDEGYTVDPRSVPAILDLVQEIAMWRASSAERLRFQNGAPRPAAPAPVVVDTAPAGNDRGYAPVRLGIQPGLAGDGESGILVESVSEGTSAADGGIKAGDVMLSWNGDSLGSVQDMMSKLRASKPGDVAKIRV